MPEKITFSIFLLFLYPSVSTYCQELNSLYFFDFICCCFLLPAPLRKLCIYVKAFLNFSIKKDSSLIESSYRHEREMRAELGKLLVNILKQHRSSCRREEEVQCFPLFSYFQSLLIILNFIGRPLFTWYVLRGFEV